MIRTVATVTVAAAMTAGVILYGHPTSSASAPPQDAACCVVSQSAPPDGTLPIVAPTSTTTKHRLPHVGNVPNVPGGRVRVPYVVRRALRG